MFWTIIYKGSSEKVQRQIAVYLHQAGIPYLLSGCGISLRKCSKIYSVRVRREDAALAILTLKKHRKNYIAD